MGILAMVCLIRMRSRLDESYALYTVHFLLQITPQKKSDGVNLQYRGGQSMSPRLPGKVVAQEIANDFGEMSRSSVS